MEEKKVYKCEKCDKIYKNYKSLWKHNYVYHKNIKVENTKTKKKKFICDKCNKNFNSRQSLWYHQKKCTMKKSLDLFDENEKLKYEKEKIKYI